MTDMPIADRLARMLANRSVSRRAAVAGGLTIASGGLISETMSAQEATPETSTDQPDTGPQFLFVQTFSGGTFTVNPAAGTPVAAGTPEAGIHGDYLLWLGGHPGQTIYFSDRPERIVGEAPTDQFLAGLGFDTGSAPNAALVTENAAGETVVAVMELRNPIFDSSAGTLTYDVTLLGDYTSDGLHHLIERNEADGIPEEFGAASLFLDDCPKMAVACNGPVPGCDSATIGTGTLGTCWSWSSFSCVYCVNADTWCDEHFSACNDSCVGSTHDSGCVNSQITD